MVFRGIVALLVFVFISHVCKAQLTKEYFSPSSNFAVGGDAVYAVSEDGLRILRAPQDNMEQISAKTLGEVGHVFLETVKALQAK